MDLSAILNTPLSLDGQQQQTPLSPTSGASSPTDAGYTPRTPMDTSPMPSCTLHSPEKASRRDGWRQQHVRGASDGWKRGEAERWNGPSETLGSWRNGRGSMSEESSVSKGRHLDWAPPEQLRTPNHEAHHYARPRRQTYAYQPAGVLSSPCEDVYRPAWPAEAYHVSDCDLSMEHADGKRAWKNMIASEGGFPAYMNCAPSTGTSASFSASISQETYDTDATISDGGSGSSPASPGPGDPSPSSPVSPSSFPSVSSKPASSLSFPSTFLSTRPKCAFVPDCTLPAPPRRIVSHYFGRNKKETRAIPESVWVFYCRQHYQRAKYRQRTEVYAQTQMRLVRQTVENLQAWGGVTDFAINLRKRAVLQLKKEDETDAKHHSGANTNARGSGRRGSDGRDLRPFESDSGALDEHTASDERWLLPFTGPHRSFDQVYDVIARVAERARTRQCPAAEFELVPNIKPEFMRRAREGKTRDN